MKKATSLASGTGSRSKAKTKIILELVKEYPETKVKEWLAIAKLPKSSYYEWKSKLENQIDKDKEVREEIKNIVKESEGRYGYRRVTLSLKTRVLTLIIKKY